MFIPIPSRNSPPLRTLLPYRRAQREVVSSKLAPSPSGIGLYKNWRICYDSSHDYTPNSARRQKLVSLHLFNGTDSTFHPR
jgi:hypothetical protein